MTTPPTGAPNANGPRVWVIDDAYDLVAGPHPGKERIEVVEKSAYDIVHRHNCMLQAKVRELEVELARYTDETRKLDMIDKLQAKLAAAEAEIDRRNIATAAMESRLHEQNAELLAWCERLADSGRNLERLPDSAMAFDKFMDALDEFQTWRSQTSDICTKE